MIDSAVIFFGLLAFPMYGHVMFNGHSNLVDTIHRSALQVGGLQLYAALDNPSTMISPDEMDERIKLGALHEPFSRLTRDNIVHSYHALLSESFNKTICFRDDMVVGLSGGLDHYNVNVPGTAWAEYGRFMTGLMGLPESYLSTTSDPNCVVTIISRNKNRRILNEIQLEDASRKLNCTAQIVDFERCTFTEQLAYMRNSTILVGIDGSGLLNAAFMRNCSTVIRIMPWGSCNEHIGNLVHKGENFKNLAEKVAGTWISYCITDPRHTVYHRHTGPAIFDLLNQTGMDASSLKIAKKFTHEQRLGFFMGQDSIVDVSEFVTLIKQAVEKNAACQLHRSETDVFGDFTDKYAIGRGTRE
jgi:hypothetical protein